MRIWILMAIAAFGLSACVEGGGRATDEEVARVAYKHNGPTRLTLFTMINNKTGAGAHTALMINGPSQRVIFDPAGSFKHESLPEQGDVIFGITPVVEDVYLRYHARKTYHVRVQQIDVSPEVARLAMREVKARGTVPSAMCSISTSQIVSRLPGFENVKTSWFPQKFSAQFGQIPGVTSRELFESDSDDNSKVLATWNPSKGS